MRNFLIMIGLAMAVCAASFTLFYVINDRPAVRRAAEEGNAMAWLRAEFRLSDTEFAAIRKLHEDYGAVCGRHCQAIMDARAASASPAEIARLEQICVDAMTAHFREVATLMPPAEGDRYLAIVIPRIQGYDHTQSPTIGGGH